MKIIPDSTVQIAQEKMITVGKILRTYREKKGLSIQEVSLATKIPTVRLTQIENEQYGDFDTQVFTRGFVKNYAEYLGLNVGKVLAIYRRSTVISRERTIDIPIKRKEEEKKETFKDYVNKVLKSFKKTEITPTSIASIIGLFIILALSIYLGIQLYKFQQPPILSIISPESNTLTEKDLFEISGVTEVGATVKVNNQVISMNTSGEFKVEVKLNEGDNIITIKSYKNNNETKAAIETRTITYNKLKAQEEQQIAQEEANKPVILEKHLAQIEITEEDAWITLTLDDKQIIAWVISPGKTEVFEFEKTLEFTSGKPRTSAIYIDNNLTSIPTDVNGIGRLNCTISNTSEIACQ